MAINWDYENMTTGLSEIDNQHKEWIRHFNEFDSAVNSHQGAAALQNTLAFLAQYTDKHFTFEEAVMQKYNCPAQMENFSAHFEFRAKLAEIESWIKEDETPMLEIVELRTVLEEWLIEHICTIDIQLREVANNRSSEH